MIGCNLCFMPYDLLTISTIDGSNNLSSEIIQFNWNNFRTFLRRTGCILWTLRSTTRQARRRGLQNVKKQCKCKHLKETTVNWIRYLMFQACFMTSKTLQFCRNDCSVRAEVNVKEQLSPLSEFSSSWRHENAQSGLAYRTRTVLGLQIIHSLCFA